MRRAAVVVMLAVVALVAATGCEPAMTITVKPPAHRFCNSGFDVPGTVSPPAATKTVVLEQTYQHQWEDVSFIYKAGAVSAHVDQTDGTYRLQVDGDRGALGTHFRVRSSGNGGHSVSFYVTPRQVDGASCS